MPEKCKFLFIYFVLISPFYFVWLTGAFCGTDGVILDAGSSGTRVHIYRWEDPAETRRKGKEADLQRLPEIKTKEGWAKKIHPGTFFLFSFSTRRH